METQNKQIIMALNSFFQEDSGKVVDYMESMLYEWYQHYAQNCHSIEHINEVVNSAFRVNDLLLKLMDAMNVALPQESPYDFSLAS
jgi:hypothetical protein